MTTTAPCPKCSRLPVSRARSCRHCGADTVVRQADRLLHATYVWCAMRAAMDAGCVRALDAAEGHRAFFPQGSVGAFLTGYSQAKRALIEQRWGQGSKSASQTVDR